jgi:hypothetical protein
MINWFNKNPVWLEDHVKDILARQKSEINLKLLEISASKGKLRQRYRKKLAILREKHKKDIAREVRKIDRFYKIIATTDKTYREAEADVYHNQAFYEAYERKLAEEEEKKKSANNYPAAPKEKQPKSRAANIRQPALNFYLEKSVNAKDRDILLNNKFKRIKVSPFGDSGATYYWVKTRYNEGKEHAFFCYLIHSELRKHVRNVKMNVTYGPDVEFEFNKQKYCFDIETGSRLERGKISVDWKYSKYQKEYDKIFIFVTRKKLKYRYARYGEVVTRGKLKQAISSIFP